MNKSIKIFATVLASTLMCVSCGLKDPHSMGIEAGKAQCKCYQQEGEEAVASCLNDIELKYKDYLNDTAYIDAAETQMLRCISDGVIDIDNPIKEVSDAKKANPLTVIDTAKNDSSTAAQPQAEKK